MWRMLVFTSLLACTSNKGSDKNSNGISTDQVQLTSESDGIAELLIDVGRKDRSLLVTAVGGTYLSIESLYDPDGDEVLDWRDWWDADESLTMGIFPQGDSVVFNWPVRGVDQGLSAGTWAVYIDTIDSSGHYQGGVDIDVVVQTKEDDSLDKGTVDVRLVYADGVGDDPDVVTATEAAVARWEDIWSGIGMHIDVTYADANIDADLKSPDADSGSQQDVSAQSNNTDVTVIIGESVGGSGSYYGISGGIPGALVAAPSSVVVVSWLANAGGDGRFSEDDIRLYGETLAHEVGHYTGQFHPVEMTYDYYDSLDDTPRCTNANTCESQLGDNLMYPYPVCDWSSCVAQEVLTSDQRGVSQRYTGAI